MVIKSRKSNTYKQYNSQKKTRQKIHKALHRTLEIEQHESHKKTGAELKCSGRTSKDKQNKKHNNIY